MVIYTIRARNPRVQFLQLNETERLSEEALLVGLQNFRYYGGWQFQIADIAGYAIADNSPEGWFEKWKNDSHLDMIINTQLVSGSVEEPKHGFKVVTVKVRAGAPIHFFDSAELVNEAGIRWRNVLQFVEIPVVFCSKDIVFFDGVKVSASKFRLPNREEAKKILAYVGAKAEFIEESEMTKRLDEIEEKYAEKYYEMMQEREEWALEHNCDVKDVVEENNELEDPDNPARLLHGLPFREDGKMMFAALTDIRAYQ